MSNYAKVLKLDDNIEEEVLLTINSIDFVAFIAYAPYSLSCNKDYPVEISFFMDELNVKKSNSNFKILIREGETFRYTINGFLNANGQLDVGFDITDENFVDYDYLYGQYVRFKVDRINVEFLQYD